MNDIFNNNLSLSDNLFNKESILNFENIKISNVTINSKAFLYILYKDVNINNMEVDNVTCLGEGGDTSLIIFDSGSSYNSMIINNLNVKNVHSNGPLVKIKGDHNEIKIENSQINDTILYGSVIESTTKKVFLLLLLLLLLL